MDSEKYYENYVGKCMISSIENKRDGSVFIIDTEINLGINLYDEKVALVAYAPTDQVFGLDFGSDGFYRAVINDETKATAFLLDIGETVDVMSPNVLGIYYISEQAQTIGPQCIPCKLTNIVDANGFELDMEVYLESWLYEPVHFLVERRNREIDLLEVSLHATVATTAKYVAKKLERVQLSEEQRRIFYEEEGGTSNALKAVFGYEPQDSKRLCPHFDAVTGRCFKGNSCRLEHIAPLEDGWTRDQQDTNLKLVPQILPRIQSVVDAIVTCADSVEDFFVYLPEKAAACGVTLESLKKKVNAPEVTKQYRQMEVLPEDLELVLFKHKGNFYRGRVECVDSQGIVITFIDYGYMETINPSNVYEWHLRWNTVPALAYQCAMNNVTMRHENDQEVIDMFQKMVFGRRILKAKIIDNVDCLTIELFDRDGMNIGDLLYSMHMVYEKEKLIPDRKARFAPA